MAHVAVSIVISIAVLIAVLIVVVIVIVIAVIVAIMADLSRGEQAMMLFIIGREKGFIVI